jgi:hypothetical protein
MVVRMNPKRTESRIVFGPSPDDPLRHGSPSISGGLVHRLRRPKEACPQNACWRPISAGGRIVGDHDIGSTSGKMERRRTARFGRARAALSALKNTWLFGSFSGPLADYRR